MVMMRRMLLLLLGRRRVHHSVAYAGGGEGGGVVTRSCARWYPVVRELDFFFIAVARSVLNDDGMSGTTLHPVVWSAAANLKRRRVEPGLIGISCLLLVSVRGIYAIWLFSVGLLLKVVHFLGSLHWPRGVDDLEVGGGSYLELLILYEKLAGERLVNSFCKTCRVAWFMRFGTMPSCLGQLVFGMGGWVNILASAISAEDIARWPYTTGLLVKWVSFFR